MDAKVALIATRPETVLADYRRVMELAGYREHLAPERELILKLNLSWTRYFPACSSAPWQLEGVVRTLREDGFAPERLLPVENRTPGADPRAGCRNNLWEPVLRAYGLSFRPLADEEWVVHRFRRPLLRLGRLFPRGIEVPRAYLGRDVLHLPTIRTDGQAMVGGAVGNSLGGLRNDFLHHAHEHVHEVLVDLVTMQRELHPHQFAVVDGTVCGDGAGPRTVRPVIKNILLAGADPVAVDATAARLMGFEPLRVPYLRLCQEMGLGTARPDAIELVGERELFDLDFGFRSRRDPVLWGDQMLRRGPLRFFAGPALRSPLRGWAPLASHLYHDWLWYPARGRAALRRFAATPWGRLLEHYRRHGAGEGPGGPVPAR